MAVTDDRPLRADARRNREAIVKAAKVIFARDGRAAQMDDIARRAKVGIGTVYRHFPTKDALLSALAEDRFAQIAGFAEDALEVEDPWEAVEGFLRASARLQASDRALSQALQEQPELIVAAVDARHDLHDAMDELIRRGQTAGVLRADFRSFDIGMVTCGLASLVHKPAGSWERLLALVLDGMRAQAARTPMPD